jgi:hypothetical protein
MVATRSDLNNLVSTSFLREQDPATSLSEIVDAFCRLVPIIANRKRSLATEMHHAVVFIRCVLA